MASKSRCAGERVRLGDVLVASFSGEWGKEEGSPLTPVLRTANFNSDGTFDYSSPAMRCIPEGKIEKKRMQRGDVVLEKSGGTPNRPVGIMAYYESDDLALCSNFNQVLRFDVDLIVPRYAFYQLRWLRSRNAFAPYTRKTTGLQNLQMTAFGSLEMRVSELSVQQVQAESLRSIEELIRLSYNLLDKLDQLVKSRFVEMFGDPTGKSDYLRTKLGSLYNVKSSKRIYAREQTKNGVPFYRLADIGIMIDGGIPESGLCISEEKYAELSKNGQVPSADDILVTARGTLGRCYTISERDRFYFQDGMITWLERTDCSPLSVYTAHVFQNDKFLDALNRDCGGTTVKYLSISDLSEVAIPVPPLTLQQEFANLVAQVDKSRFAAQQQIEKLQMLYDSLAQDYFG